MNENVLKSLETFNEFPDKYLKIKSDSNYYFINKKIDSFVTEKKIDSIFLVKIYGKEKIVEKESFYDVISGKLVLKTECIENLDGSAKEYIKKEKNVILIELNSILENKDEVFYLSKMDIKKLIRNNEKFKDHTLIYKK